MKSFSLGRLRDKVGRRFSDPSAEFDRSSFGISHRRNSNNDEVLAFEAEEMFASISGELVNAALSERHHRSRSMGYSRRQAKELVRQETSQVIQKKLLSVLKDLGLQLPIPLKSMSGLGGVSRSMKIYVANTHDCVFLASSVSTSFTYEDTEDEGNEVPDSDLNFDFNDLEESSAASRGSSVSDNDSETSERSENESSHMSNTLMRKMRALKSANYLCAEIDSNTPIPHLFAVIIELKEDCSPKTVEVEFSSGTRTLWPLKDSYNRHICEENFKIGSLEWELSFDDADLFINSKNSKDTHLRDIDPQHLAEKTREFKLFDARESSCDVPEDSSLFSGGRRYSIDSTSSTNTDVAADTQKAGLYVFLLPILLPPNIPSTVNTVNGHLVHKLNVCVQSTHEKSCKKHAVSAKYNLPMVRTPPSVANSIADKPIYVSRIWNDSLHYSITFPKKFISLGSEHAINVKLIPMAKDVTVKRIKFNILEKLTYVSRDLTREYEYDGDESSSRYRNSRSRERVVPLYELRTKAKSSYNGAEPFKEELISCPGNNLLFSCYEDRPSSADSTRSKEKSVMVASPLDINIALPFLTSRADKEILSSSINDDDQEAGSFSPRRSGPRRDSIASLDTPSSPFIGSLETHISHINGQPLNSGVDEDILRLESSSYLSNKSLGRNDSISRGFTTTSKALSPDSNFRHIQISHRLQVCFRISKPDAAKNNKMHHYEVVVDTPIVLLSAKCSESSMQLPKYNEFQAAIPEISPQRPNGMNVRAPSYVGNGVSIMPLDLLKTDALPTFEEATSAASMKKNSATPSDPPAYEDIPFNHEADLSNCSHKVDDLLIEQNLNSGESGPSVKASLQSSFAPSISTDSNSSSTKDSSSKGSSSKYSGSTENTTPSHCEEVISSASSDDLSSGNAHYSTESSSFNEVRLNMPLDEMKSIASSQFEATNEVACPGSRKDVMQKIAADEAQFDQRLPLLRYESVTGVESHVDKISYSNRVPNTGTVSEDWKRSSTETISQQTDSQSMFHAY